MTKQKHTLPILALIFANILWGFSPPLIKMGQESIPVPIFIAIRFSLAGLLILPFALKVWQPLKGSQLRLLAVASILYVTLSVGALNIGLTKTTASNSGIIWLLMPVLLFLLSASFLKEKLSLKTFIGIMLALAGSLFIIGKPWDSGGATSLTGDLLVVIAVFLNAVSIIISKPLTKSIPYLQISFLSFFIGVLPVVIYAITQVSSWDIGATTTRSWTALLVSVLTVAIANSLFFYALRSKTVQSTGMYEYIDPVITVMAAWVLLSERPTIMFYIGAAMIAVGVYVVETRAKFKLNKSLASPP